MNFNKYLIESYHDNIITWITGWVDSVGDDNKNIRQAQPNDSIINQLSKFKPKNVVKLYRGDSEYSFKNPLMSFTYDKDVAKDFSENGKVYEFEIHPDMILVDFTKIPNDLSNLISKETEMFKDAKDDLKEVIVFSNKIKDIK